MKIKFNKNGRITMSATKDDPHSLTNMLREMADAVEKKKTKEPQECYKTGEPCEHNCSGLCKESC